MALVNQMLGELPLEERAETLRDSCDKVKPEHTYTKFLTEEELAQRRERKLILDIKLSEMEQELSEYTKEAKDGMKPLKEEAFRILSAVRDRVERCTGTVYIFRDEDSRMLGFYDETGALVFARRMTPEEMQGSLLSEIRVSSAD